ncbi:ATP-binding protein [Natronorubrum aibiense]|uniref:Chemotaxis protein CheA n=1 Tax=Natronorubrum aibiense TaxID=348826 RepID=A0A5P9P592_9EURY|nr:ATP-binding protein [Natronorubrum aibiense]QFU82980.1 chemotaxis protein CheA [Natronorubrum aibiense]
MTDYLTDFVQESEERITELNNALLTFEREPTNDEAMESIFRVAHTLKSNCGAMGLESASDLAHAIEDLLDAVRRDDLEVTPELMDVIFEGVDELETLIDEVAATGEVQTDPSATIEALRAHLDGQSEATGVTTPSTEEIDAILERIDPPADDEHELYLARLALTERDGVNTSVLVVDALIDAFELLGTEPPRRDIEAGNDDGRVDAVFASAVGEAAITSGLEPVDEVADFELVTVTDRFDALEEPSEPTQADGSQSAEPGDDLSADEAKALEVDELLDEFDEFDDLDEMVEDVDDDDLDVFDDMGEAGSFDDLLGDDDLFDDEQDVPTADAASTVVDEWDEPSDPDTAPSSAAADDDVDDASAVFDELKSEVEMVGFDELQDELDELEFDEFDSDDEVEMDELIGEDVDIDDDTFLDETEPADDVAANEVVDDSFGEADDDENDPDDAALESDDLESERAAESTADVEPVSTSAEPEAAADDTPPADELDATSSPADESATAADESALESETAVDATSAVDADLEARTPSETDDGLEGDDVDAVADEADTADLTDGSDEAESLEDETNDPFADDDVENYTAFTESDDAFDESVGDFSTFDEEFDDGFDDTFGKDVDDGFDDAFADDVFGDDDFDDAFGDDFDPDDTGETEPTTFSQSSTESFGDDSAEAKDEADDDVVRRIDEPTFEIPEITVPETADRSDADEQSDESQSIRVDVDQIDSLLTLVEGLVTTRVRLRDAVTDGGDTAALEAELDDLSDLTTELQETVMDVRLVPLETVTNRLPRVVRDIAREQDKAVEFEITGEDVELDRSILDRIGDPLTHLIRNAVDHGIELPEEREAAGKPETGTVEVHAERSRDSVTITVEDDGSGLDPDRLRSEAVDAGVLSESEAAALSDDDAADLIFHSGLSTTDEITDVSGRGVGMDVVKRTIEDLEGTVSIDSDPGEGTRVTMTLPVTVAIDDVLFLESGGEEFGVPTKAVLDIEPADRLEQVDGHAALPEDDDAYSVIQLDDALETPRAGDNGDGMLVRIRDDIRPVVLHCDRVHGQQEVVVKPFEGFMGGIPGLSGATVRGRGEVVNILDVTTL